MDESNLIALLSLAFSLGILHALDADHVMAVSGLCSQRQGWRSTLRFCVRWSIGHGATLLLIGSAVLLFGLAIPNELSHIAENMIGFVLICIGVFVLWNLFRKRAHLHLHFHDHDNLPRHAHWHIHDKHASKHHHKTSHAHDHSATMVGILHGAAGSAPLLALIPMSKAGAPVLGLLYLAIFSLGVIISMMAFGGLLGSLYGWLSRWGNHVVRVLRAFVGAGSIMFGSYIVYGAM